MNAHTALRESPLFAKLGDEHIATLEQLARIRTVPTGTMLTTKGTEHALAMYFILDGKVEVQRDGFTLTTLGPGDNFGEMALMIPELPRSADVVAVSETSILQLAVWDFVPVLKHNPEVAVAVIEQLARRLIEADRKLVEVYSKSE